MPCTIKLSKSRSHIDPDTNMVQKGLSMSLTVIKFTNCHKHSEGQTKVTCTQNIYPLLVKKHNLRLL